MKLAHQQLEQHLAKNLAPIYIVSGDELLLTQEAVDLIRGAAHKNGFTERTLITGETGVDWGKLFYSDAHSLSLFANKRILELHIAGIKPNSATSQLLQEYADNIVDDILLLIHTNKLDSKTEQSAWFKALEKKGIAISVWPIPVEQLPHWIMQRAKKAGLNVTKTAAELLATQVEGNLLAAAQEIEKLSLLPKTEIVDEKAIENAVTDNAHFDIFNLVDSALAGNQKRTLRILQNLAEEDIEPTLVLWALTRELRTLTEILQQSKQGVSLASLFSKFRIWEKRQPNVRAFLQRHSQTSCWELLVAAAQVDRVIKGAEVGNVWDELQQLVLKIG